MTRPSCLISSLFDHQLEFFSPINYPSEFSSYILKNISHKNIYRIYYSVGDGKTFDSSPPSNEKIWSGLISDIASGKWQLHAHLHSHPFMVNYPPASHLGGTVYPSDEDIQFYLYLIDHFDLKEAWITNGFTQVIYGQDEIIHFLRKTIPSHKPY